MAEGRPGLLMRFGPGRTAARARRLNILLNKIPKKSKRYFSCSLRRWSVILRPILVENVSCFWSSSVIHVISGSMRIFSISSSSLIFVSSRDISSRSILDRRNLKKYISTILHKKRVYSSAEISSDMIVL